MAKVKYDEPEELEFEEEMSYNPYLVRPNEIEPGDGFGYKIVAVRWAPINGWCAFRGPTGWTDAHVAANGDMISEEIARKLFPCFNALNLVYTNL